MVNQLPESSINAVAVSGEKYAGVIAALEGVEAVRTQTGLLVICLPLSESDRIQFATTPPDTTWLAGRLSLQHERITQLSAVAPVFPLQFGMLAADIDELLGALSLRAAELEDYFARIQGCQEWSLRLTSALQADATEAGDEDDEGEVSGLEWLMRRKRLPEQAREENDQQVMAVRQAVEQRLLGLAKAHQERAVQVEPPGRQTLLNIALLLGTDNTQTAQNEVAAISESLPDRLELSLSGPWAPYSFRPRIDAS